MQCPSCRHDNPQGAKFCSECGAALHQSCPSCGKAASPNAKFCAECGAALGASASHGSSSGPPTAASVSIRHAEAERRQLTVMFCDLVEATALSTRLDPEDLREVIGDFQNAARQSIAEFDGHIAQHLGDGLLVYFGYPRAHEDDAARSVHAGLGVVQRVKELNEHLERQMSVRLAVRVGIHTGLTVVGAVGSGGDTEQLAIGETPNLAARLQGVAPHDTVVVSEETARLVPGAFDCEPLREFQLKGFEKPRQVFRILGPAARRLHLAVDDTPFVGRQAELSAIRALWEQALDGAGGSVMIRGGVGVGKSRLVNEIANSIVQDHPLLHARCSPHLQATAMSPVGELVMQLLEWSDTDDDPAKLAKLTDAVSGLQAGDPQAIPLLTAFLGLTSADASHPQPPLTPQVRKGRTDAVLFHLVFASVRDEPTAILVEDLHWMDQSTLEFLAGLVDQVVDHSVLLVLTSRNEFQAPFEVFTELRLDRLPRKAVEMIIADVTKGQRLPVEIVRQIVLKADGNPLFVEELTRMVVESELIEDVGATSQPGAAPVPGLTIPATLQDSLMARLDQLEPTHKALIQLCATIGRQFSDELIRETLRAFEEDMENELRRLTDGELLFERGVAPRSIFVFKHALVQDVAYSSLLRRTRTRYHSRVADVLVERFPDTPPEVLAHHYTEAGRLVEAVAQRKAAGAAALGQFALAESMSHLSQGLQLASKLPNNADGAATELELRLLYGVPLMLTQGFAAADVGDNYARMLELCDRVGDQSVQQHFAALWGLWTFYIVSGRYDNAKEMADRLTGLAGRAGDSRIKLASHTALGAAVLMRGELAEARRQFEHGLAVYDLAEHAPLALICGQDAGAMCSSFLTWVHFHDGDSERAEARAEEAAELAKALNQPSTHAFVGTVLATWRCLRGEFDEAIQLADMVIGHAREQGMPHWEAQAQCARGWAMARKGQAEEGADVVRVAIAGLAGIGTRASMTFYWGGLADAELAAGRLDAAREALEKARTYMTSSDERIHEGGLALLEGRIAAAEGDWDRARTAFASAVAIAEGQRAHGIVQHASALLEEKS